jgi:hypothetical protein
MRPTVSGRVDLTAVIISIAGLALLMTTASPVFSATALKHTHSQRRKALIRPQPRIVAEPAIAEALKRQAEALTALQLSQSALAKQMAGRNAQIQQQISELNVNSADYQKQTQQMLEQVNRRVDSLRSWLKSIVVVFVLCLAALLYIVVRLPALPNSFSQWRAEVPDSDSDHEGTSKWQSGEATDRSLEIRGTGQQSHVPD